ncbi:MAG: sulfotransferase [Magnetococcales bacterium]|nr:sulfotransferase [Magnetococcales bacterium]
MSTKKSLHVPLFIDLLGGLIHNRKKFWIGLGNLESEMMEKKLANVAVESPIFVSGLARSGSTILLEILAKTPNMASHLNRDFPFVFTPFWTNQFLAKTSSDSKPVERAGADRILTSPDSPIALEEVLWMAFFNELHNPNNSALLDATTSNPSFETFYRNHIRKLILVRGGKRYLSKANYNITRLEYLLQLFPDARFIVPIRHPEPHIASLMKQHNLFNQGENDNPRALRFMHRQGHFEYGLGRRPLNTGPDTAVEQVLTSWQRGEEVQGWAIYWNDIHRFIYQRLATNKALQKATLVVRYEDLCSHTSTTLERIFAHSGISDAEDVIAHYREKISLPSYYKANFSQEDKNIIHQYCNDTAQLFDYDDEDNAVK